MRRLLSAGSEVGLFVNVVGLVPKPLGSSEGIDEPLGFDGLEPLLESFIEQVVACLGQDLVGKLVQIGSGNVVEDLVLGKSYHGFPKITYSALNRRRSGMVNTCVKLVRLC